MTEQEKYELELKKELTSKGLRSDKSGFKSLEERQELWDKYKLKNKNQFDLFLSNQKELF